MHVYRTQNNESIYDIARKYEISPVKIAEDNDLEIRGRLPMGREILVLIPSRTYNVKSGDTLERIATRFKTTKEALMRLNPGLEGREKIYTGQLLTIKDSSPSYGMISTNGYLYSGTTKDKLTMAIPHLSYVTICSAIYKDNRVHNIFSTDETISFIRSTGRAPILRVYMTELPLNSTDFANSVTILAKSAGFVGITISSLNSLCNDAERNSAIVLSVRKALIENDLLLFVEGEADKDTSYFDYADAGILTYDKIHKCDIPNFENGETTVFTEFANSSESCRAFIEISSFAFANGKYIEKSEALRTCDRKHIDISNDCDKKLQRALYGKYANKEIVFESLENTIAKLELVSELGYMGISFDIGRICTSDLMATSCMFNIISCPIMNPRIYN